MNSKYCPRCHCTIEVVRIGKTSSGRQRYKCKSCNITWTNKPRPRRLEELIWHDFVWNNSPVRILAKRYKKHANTIRDILHKYQPAQINLSKWDKVRKKNVKVIIMDTTYFGRTTGVITVLDAHTGELLYFKVIKGSETNHQYYMAFCNLREAGINPKACVLDGRKGVAELLEEMGVLVQMCHFHMWQIVRRYLTNNPVLEPNIELKMIVDNFLSKRTPTSNNTFTLQLRNWKTRNERWLNEKHKNDSGRMEWTHEETRRAYNAIISHGRWLFTYEKYPELNIPKTSNRIEGKFGNAKDKLRIHHGYDVTLKIKIFFSLLSGE